MASAGELGVENVLDVLERTFDLTGEEHGDEYKILCPNPGHKDRHPSCGVNLGTGYWHCFSCGVGGDLIKLGEYVTGLDADSVEAELRPSTIAALQTTLSHRLSRLNISTLPPQQKNVALPGPYRDDPLDYLLERGLKLDTLRKWGVQFCLSQELQGKKGQFTIKCSIAIPIRDETGRLLAWCYRATDNSPQWQPKYIYSPEVDISRFWWGLEHNGHADDVAVVEGAIDGMTLDQLGFPAVASLGSSMPESKILQLQRFKSLTLFGDRDSSGIMMVQKIGKLLGHRMPIRIARYAKWMPGKDVNAMNPIDVEIMMERAIPWTRHTLQLAGH